MAGSGATGSRTFGSGLRRPGLVAGVTLRVADQEVGGILDDPLGNHLVMVRGRRRDRLERWWRLAFG